MNPGEMNKRITVKEAVTSSEGVIWADAGRPWAKVTEGKEGLIAAYAVKSEAIEITARETDITPANAVLFRDENYLVTSVLREGEHPVYLKIKAAKGKVHTLHVFRPVKGKNDFGATVWETEEIMQTVGCIAEKYVNHSSETGHDETETELILVTPKLTVLQEGDSIEEDGDSFKVVAAYLTDEYKNQYRLRRAKDN